MPSLSSFMAAVHALPLYSLKRPHQTNSLPTNDIIYGPRSTKLYVSVPSQGGAAIGNSVTVIDPWPPPLNVRYLLAVNPANWPSQTMGNTSMWPKTARISPQITRALNSSMAVFYRQWSRVTPTARHCSALLCHRVIMVLIVAHMVADTQAKRVFFLTYEQGSKGVLRAYNAETYLLEARLDISTLTASIKTLVRWGKTGPATRTLNDKILIIDAPSLVPRLEVLGIPSYWISYSPRCKARPIGCAKSNTHCMGSEPTITIQETPKRSATMPKRGAKKVCINGICTWPPSASAANRRSASEEFETVSDNAKP